MKLIDLAIGGVIVADAHMRAACEEQGEWVELSISARIVPRHSWGILSTQLYIFARSVSKEVCVARFAAGVDDWEDPSMRLFTNERVGPVAFGESGVTWGQQ